MGGDDLGKLAENCMKITKLLFLGQNIGGTANFWGSGGIPQFPLLGETLASLFHIKKKKFYQKILQKLWPEN